MQPVSRILMGSLLTQMYAFPVHLESQKHIFCVPVFFTSFFNYRLMFSPFVGKFLHRIRGFPHAKCRLFYKRDLSNPNRIDQSLCAFHCLSYPRYSLPKCNKRLKSYCGPGQYRNGFSCFWRVHVRPTYKSFSIPTAVTVKRSKSNDSDLVTKKSNPAHDEFTQYSSGVGVTRIKPFFTRKDHNRPLLKVRRNVKGSILSASHQLVEINFLVHVQWNMKDRHRKEA